MRSLKGAVNEKYNPSGDIWNEAFSGFRKKSSRGICGIIIFNYFIQQKWQ